jgi:hypothetical protein
MRRVVQFVAGLVIATSALANDSGASIAPGGLVLQRDEATDPPSRASPQPKAEAQPAASPGHRLVTLNSFSCGDFCYLELTEEGRASRALLCAWRDCAATGATRSSRNCPPA